MCPITSHRAPRPAASAAGFVFAELAAASKRGGVVAMQEELGLPIKLVGLGALQILSTKSVSHLGLKTYLHPSLATR